MTIALWYVQLVVRLQDAVAAAVDVADEKFRDGPGCTLADLERTDREWAKKQGWMG
ncbi:hypothetical protein [Ramlibacter sp.]|uniref:hypothetical protein n=1 Tax=Ramlibacter sp. TaxID=1917967 RepID=UPI003D0A4464